ncbi:MAG: putative dipeptidase PepE [Acidimicrobiaceae bacterium]|nr:putative dipeptidase PepE [Acidimicrobiaceae bacterium]
MGDQTWAGFLVDLVAELPGVRFSRASEVTAPIRSVKDASEVEALRAAGSAVDRIAAQIQAGEIPLVGRTEAEVSAQIGRRIIEEGHHRVNFAIVASGPNAASPHHEAGDRVIRPGEAVLFDFGGTMADADGVGYCSDITRCVHVGEPAPGFAELYEVLFASHAAGVAAATVGTPCEVVDAAARDVIEHGGYGEFFIHRTGHGIGVEAHEHPNIVVGNDLPLVPGHAFSVEPGIYVPGEWGARLEDIVVAAADGPDAMNLADHSLAVVDG